MLFCSQKRWLWCCSQRGCCWAAWLFDMLHYWADVVVFLCRLKWWYVYVLHRPPARQSPAPSWRLILVRSKWPSWIQRLILSRINLRNAAAPTRFLQRCLHLMRLSPMMPLRWGIVASFKEIDLLKMKILSWFTHPWVVPNLYEFLISQRYFSIQTVDSIHWLP